MADLNVVFDVPKWVEAGVASGKLQVFGGVVRDNAGRIVHHLSEAACRAPRGGKLAIVALAVAAAAGGGYLLYRRYSRKGKTLAALELVESAMTVYLDHAREGKLTLDEVEALSDALGTFLNHLRKPEFRDAQIIVSNDVQEKLRDFLRSLRAFNQAAHKKLPALPKPPSAVSKYISLETLLDELFEQVRYQQSVLVMASAT